MDEAIGQLAHSMFLSFQAKSKGMFYKKKREQFSASPIGLYRENNELEIW